MKVLDPLEFDGCLDVPHKFPRLADVMKIGRCQPSSANFLMFRRSSKMGGFLEVRRMSSSLADVMKLITYLMKSCGFKLSEVHTNSHKLTSSPTTMSL